MSLTRPGHKARRIWDEVGLDFVYYVRIWHELRASPLAFGELFLGRDTQRETASSQQVATTGSRRMARFRGPRLVGMHNL